jgi:hypothetical protein
MAVTALAVAVRYGNPSAVLDVLWGLLTPEERADESKWLRPPIGNLLHIAAKYDQPDALTWIIERLPRERLGLLLRESAAEFHPSRPELQMTPLQVACALHATPSASSALLALELDKCDAPTAVSVMVQGSRAISAYNLPAALAIGARWPESAVVSLLDAASQGACRRRRSGARKPNRGRPPV